jgi:hypothetical protein
MENKIPWFTTGEETEMEKKNFKRLVINNSSADYRLIAYGK